VKPVFGRIQVFLCSADREDGANMLQIKNLTLQHKKDLRILLQDFSCVINTGDKVVIIGEEGNGKSTLLKWIYDESLVEDYIEAKGEKICHHESLGYLPQELSVSEKNMSVYQFFSMEPAFFDQSPKELGRLAGLFHLEPDFLYGEQLMGTLSGGERVKACLLRLQIKNPTILLLDEPSNDLDLETLKWLEEMIDTTQQAVVFISHDETLIERTANYIIHLEQINRKRESRYKIWKGSYQDYLINRHAFFENQEQLFKNAKREQKKKDEKLQKILDRVERAQDTVSRQDPHSGQLLKKKMKAVKSMEKRFEREKEDLPQKMEMEEAMYLKLGQNAEKIANGKVVLEYNLEKLLSKGEGRILATDIQLQIRGPEKIVIVGENGVGKTTLLEKIAEELLQRKDIKTLYMPQNYEDLLDLSKNPIDFLEVSGMKEERTKIRTYLGALKFTADEMIHPMSDLSGGQKGKVLLLKLSLSDVNVLILDEPTRNFSPLSGPVIRRLLADFPGVILSISHDRKYIDEVCDVSYQLTKTGLIKLQ